MCQSERIKQNEAVCVEPLASSMYFHRGIPSNAEIESDSIGAKGGVGGVENEGPDGWSTKLFVVMKSRCYTAFYAMLCGKW